MAFSLLDGGEALAVGVVVDQPHLGVVAEGGEAAPSSSWIVHSVNVGKPGRMHNKAVAQRLKYKNLILAV